MTQIALIHHLPNAMILKPGTERALDHLEPADRKIIEAGLYPPLAKISEELSIDTICEALGATYILAGQSADNVQLPTYASAFYHRLMEEFPFATLAEINQALENGVYEQYGAYFGLNPRTFVVWVRCYIEDNKRQSAKEAFARAKKKKVEPVEPLPPYWDDAFWSENHRNKWMAYANLAFDYHLKGDTLSLHIPEAVYWILRKENLITESKERTAELMDYARGAIRAQTTQNKASRTGLEIQKILEKIEAATDTDIKIRVQLEAKRIAVYQYFEQEKIAQKTNIFPNLKKK